jgi:hypothetical protein
MKLNCPYCNATDQNFIQTSRINLDGDNWWDDIDVAILQCPNCQEKVVGVYKRERRGGSSFGEVYAYQMNSVALQALEEAIAQCPNKDNSGCQCPTHQNIGKKTDKGDWIGLEGVDKPFYTSRGFD